MRLDAALLVWLALGGTARAWSLNGSSWGWQGQAIEDPLQVDPDTFAPEVGEDDLFAAIDGAMATWNDAGYDLSLSWERAQLPPVQDAEAALMLFEGTDTETGVTLAYTTLWGYEDGLAYDCDVLFLDADDDGDITWSADPDGPADGTWDVQSVALHELGHCLGLSHSEDGGAIMYARYTGARALGADDFAGLAALYAPACADADGDGVSACDGDCADDNASISPAAMELCDGVDDNCNGVVDEAEGLVVAVGDDSSDADWSGLSVGNGLTVDAASTLRSVRQRWEGPEGARLVWSISKQEGRSWALVAERRGVAVSGEWQQSPVLDVPLEAGETYAVVLGSVSNGVTMYYQKRPDLDANGPLTPLGSLYGRAIGDELTSPDERYLVDQELTLTADPATGCTPDTGGADDTADTGGGAPDTADSAADTGKFAAAPCTCSSGSGGAGWAALAVAAALGSRSPRRRGARQDRIA